MANMTTDPSQSLINYEADTSAVEPFCFRCFEMDAKTMTLYWIECGRILCAKCRSRLDSKDGKVKCSVHNKLENCIPINDQMPKNLIKVFRNDDDNELKQIAHNMDNVAKMNNELNTVVSKLPPNPADECLQRAESALVASKVRSKKLDMTYQIENDKLKRDLKSTLKMDHYFEEYERRAKRTISKNTVKHQPTTKDPRLKMPPPSTMSSISGPSPKVVEKQTEVNDSGYQSRQSDLKNSRTNIAKSTPNRDVEIDTLSNDSSLYTAFRREINRPCPSTAQSTPVKSILKKSSSHKSSSSGGTSTFVCTPALQRSTPVVHSYRTQTKTVHDHVQNASLHRSRSNINTPNDVPRNVAERVPTQLYQRIGNQTNRNSPNTQSQRHSQPATSTSFQSISSGLGKRTPDRSSAYRLHGQQLSSNKPHTSSGPVRLPHPYQTKSSYGHAIKTVSSDRPQIANQIKLNASQQSRSNHVLSSDNRRSHILPRTRICTDRKLQDNQRKDSENRNNLSQIPSPEALKGTNQSE